MLEHKAHFGALLLQHLGFRGQQLTINGNRAGFRPFQAGDAPQQCALSGSGGSDDADDLSFFHAEGAIPDGIYFAKGFGNIYNINHFLQASFPVFSPAWR